MALSAAFTMELDVIAAQRGGGCPEQRNGEAWKIKMRRFAFRCNILVRALENAAAAKNASCPLPQPLVGPKELQFLATIDDAGLQDLIWARALTTTGHTAIVRVSED